MTEAPSIDLECDVEDVWPQETDWVSLADRAFGAAAVIAPELDCKRLMVSLLFTDDDAIQVLNRDWRGKDRPTNVLSFPMLTRDELLALAPEGPPQMLGDIALAFETCAREANEKAISLQDHTAHLIVHGTLHLAGHDHMDEAEAEAMETLEVKALALLGIANPYSG